MDGLLKRIGEIGIIPMISIDRAEDAVPLAEALERGGLPVVEITFRTAAAEQSMKNIAKSCPNVIIGAGTVLNVNQVKAAVDAGAVFIVSPGFNPDVVGYCVKNNIPVTPGCSTPTDIERAIGFGLDVVKFFPAEASGGIKALQAISAPYSMMKFIPTGGISTENMLDYLKNKFVLAVGGSWLAKKDMINEGRFDEITRIARESVNMMLGFGLAHIGINADTPESQEKSAERFSEVFGMPLKKGTSSIFAGKGIEVLGPGGLGHKGHIAIETNDMRRAISYLERMGVEIDMSTAKGAEGGVPKAVYLKEEIGGFAVHLLRKA